MDPFTLAAIIGIPLLLGIGKKSSNKIKISHKPHLAQPYGKGLIFRSLAHANTKEEFFKDIKDLQLDWICVLTHWQSENEPLKRYLSEEHLKWLQELYNTRKFKIWFWAFPQAGREIEFLNVCLEYTKYNMCSGYIINAEKSYIENYDAANKLVLSLKTYIKKPLGLISYGGGDIHVPKFPWVQFSYLNFGIPQIYDKEKNLGNEYPKQSIDSWQKYFKIVFPAWTVSSIHSIADLNKIIDNTPHASTCLFWDYYLLKDDPQKFNFVKNLIISKS